MSTTITGGPTVTPGRTRPAHHWPIVLLVAALAAAVGAGSWTLVDRLTRTSGPAAEPAASYVLPDVIGPFGLQHRLVEAGYAIPVDGTLDPVTLSAAADYLRVAPGQELGPWLGTVLAGTVITGRRDPAAWNDRFGTDRLTRNVERPLVGPGGQLDANGNLR